MRKKVTYFIIILIVMGLGLFSRKYMFILPENIAPFIGDMLWAMMIYFGIRFLFINITLLKSLSIALIFSFIIEISQLYQAEWINKIRGTTLGGLVLGYGFLWEDLISYCIGVVIGLIIDKLLMVYFVKTQG